MEQVEQFQPSIPSISPEILIPCEIKPIPVPAAKRKHALTAEGMNLDEWEQQQLEHYFKKKCIKVIFDSETDNWSTGMAIYSRIHPKSLYLFVIEDTENNKFGFYRDEDLRFYYLNSQLFTLKRNGERKFDVYKTIFTSNNSNWFYIWFIYWDST